MQNIIRCLVSVILLSGQLNAGFFPLDFFKKQTAQFFVSEFEEKKQQLAALQENFVRLQHDETIFGRQMQHELTELQKQAGFESSEAGISRDFIQKKQALINDNKQLFGEIQRLYQQINGTLRKSIDLLKTYVDDSLFVDIHLVEKSWYSFDELQATAKQFYSASDELRQCKENKKRVEQEIQSAPHELENFEQILKQKEREIKLLPHNGAHKLLGLELENLRKKIDHIKLKKQLLVKQLEFAQLQLFVVTKKVELLRKDLTRIERTLWVTDIDVQREQERFNTLKSEHDERREIYVKTLASTTRERDYVQKEFERANALLKQPIKDIKQLSDWQYGPADEAGFYRVLALYVHAQSLESALMLMDAQQALDDVQLARDEFKVETMKAWLAVSQRRFLHNVSDHTKQLEIFSAKKSELERQIEEYKNKSSELANRSSVIMRVLGQLQHYLDQINGDKKFVELRRARALLQEQQGRFDELAKLYTTIIGLKTELNNYLDLIVQKLSSTSSVFQRSAGAITLEGIRSVGADLRFFIDYMFAVISTRGALQVVAWFRQLIGDLFGLLNLLFAFVVAMALYFASLVVLPLLREWIMRVAQQHGATFVSSTVLVFIQFIQTNLLGMITWLTLFYLVRYDWVITIGTPAKIVFYVVSIFYLCALLTKLKRFYVATSPQFFQKDFAYRALAIGHFFIVLTIAAYFLSEALITTVYGHSALSRALWALYSLIARALMVFLIMDKNLILGIIPEHGVVWSIVHERVKSYYYLFLLLAIFLIVLSDPFIGYGLLVSTMLKAAILTVATLVIFRWLHEFLRQYSSHIFFVSSGDGAKERFAHSKTWYALFIVVSFGLLIIGALLLFARIWGHPLALSAVGNFFDLEIARVPGDVAGTIVSITLKSLLVVIAFIFGGFLLSTLFTRYVLQRIYMLLHIDAGVQNTITRVSGYLFIIIPLILGLQRAGFGSWIPSLAVLLMLGIAWAVKGPADDFFAYFIILVERSIKIGDYIRVDSLRGEISGVVRKITPRSVVLRRKNSYAIIVPNSKILRTYVYNWNYSHNYFGFEDIYITVAYEADQEKVREILLAILHTNPLILKNPAPVIRIDNFTINGYEILIRGFLSSSEVLNQWDIRSDIRFAVLREFKKNNIKLAAPIQGIKLDINRSGDDQ